MSMNVLSVHSLNKRVSFFRPLNKRVSFFRPGVLTLRGRAYDPPGAVEKVEEIVWLTRKAGVPFLLLPVQAIR
jgi:hypothetical protein